jgi:hypothetical protein
MRVGRGERRAERCKEYRKREFGSCTEERRTLRKK